MSIIINNESYTIEQAYKSNTIKNLIETCGVDNITIDAYVGILKGIMPNDLFSITKDILYLDIDEKYVKDIYIKIGIILDNLTFKEIRELLEKGVIYQDSMYELCGYTKKFCDIDHYKKWVNLGYIDNYSDNHQYWKNVYTFEGHNDSVESGVFSPCGKYILSASSDKTLKLWDIQSKECIYTFIGHNEYVNSCVFSPCGKYILSASGDKTLKLWDVQNKDCIHTFIGHTKSVKLGVFSPCGKYILSASYDTTLKLWDIQSKDCIHTFYYYEIYNHFDKFKYGFVDCFITCVFSPCGKYILSLSSQNHLILWDIQSKKCVHSLSKKIQTGKSIKLGIFSPTGYYISTSSLKKNLKSWDIQSKECINTFIEHNRYIMVGVSSPCGKYILSGLKNRDMLKLWDIQNKECVKILEGHIYTDNSSVINNTCVIRYLINSGVFSQCGKYILTASCDYTLKLWEIIPPKN